MTRYRRSISFYVTSRIPLLCSTAGSAPAVLCQPVGAGEAGTHVLVDRYAYSGVAFSAAKPRLSLEWCKQWDRGLPRPDLVRLEVSEQAAASRADWGGERYELTEFQRAVRENYSKLCGPDWVTVSGEGGLEEVEQALYSVVAAALNRNRGSLGKLWEQEEDRTHS